MVVLSVFILALFLVTVCSVNLSTNDGKTSLESHANYNFEQEKWMKVEGEVVRKGREVRNGGKVVRNGFRRLRRSSMDNRLPQMPDESKQVIDTKRPRIHLIPRAPEGFAGGCFSNHSLAFNWKRSSEIPTQNMGMVHEDNFIQVPQSGVYFVYAQLYIRLPPSKYGHCITKGILDEKDFPKITEYMCTAEYAKDKYNAGTKYVGGPVYLREKDIVGVGMRPVGKMDPKLEKFIYLDPTLNFFGAYLI